MGGGTTRRMRATAARRGSREEEGERTNGWVRGARDGRVAGDAMILGGVERMRRRARERRPVMDFGSPAGDACGGMLSVVDIVLVQARSSSPPVVRLQPRRLCLHPRPPPPHLESPAACHPAWRYSVVVITQDSDSPSVPGTQVRALVAPHLFAIPLRQAIVGIRNYLPSKNVPRPIIQPTPHLPRLPRSTPSGPP